MKKNKRQFIYLGLILIIALTIFLTTACGDDSSSDNKGSDGAASGKGMTEFTSITLDGEEIDQSVFAANDVTMVNFWATYCGPCINEMPDLAEILKERQDKGFNIIGVVTDVQNTDEGMQEYAAEEAHKIIDQTGANYTHLLLSSDIITNMVEPYSINSIPTTFFVDSNGKVIDGPHIGSLSKSGWDKIIDDVMNK